MLVYTVLSLVFPAKETFLSQNEFDKQQDELDLEVRKEEDGSTEEETSKVVKTHAHPA